MKTTNFDIPKDSVILSIDSEYYDEKLNLKGLKIITSSGDIKLLIEDSQSCYEEYGYKFLETPDNIESFIKSKILNIDIIDIGFSNDDNNDEHETQIKIKTSDGYIQYAVYNIHNGFYAHTTFLQIFEYKLHNIL